MNELSVTRKTLSNTAKANLYQCDNRRTTNSDSGIQNVVYRNVLKEKFYGIVGWQAQIVGKSSQRMVSRVFISGLTSITIICPKGESKGDRFPPFAVDLSAKRDVF